MPDYDSFSEFWADMPESSVSRTMQVFVEVDEIIGYTELVDIVNQAKQSKRNDLIRQLSRVSRPHGNGERIDHTPLTDNKDLSPRDVVYKDSRAVTKYLRRLGSWTDDMEEKHEENIAQAKRNALNHLERRVKDNARELNQLAQDVGDNLAEQVRANKEAIQTIIQARNFGAN